MTWAIKVGNFGRDRKYKKKKSLMEMLKGEKNQSCRTPMESSFKKYVCVCVHTCADVCQAS